MSVVHEEDAPAARPSTPVPAPVSVLPLPSRAGRAPRSLQRVLAIGASHVLVQRVQSVGKTGASGVALLVFALAFFAGANVAVRNNVDVLRASLDEAQHSTTIDSSAPQMRVRAVRELVSALPERSALPDITGKIVAQAQAAGIELERGNYDLTVTHSGRLVRARMTFPVHGRYPDIRRFIDSTLATVPGAAVDGLRLERKDIGVAEIDAQIRFAVYVRGTP